MGDAFLPALARLPKGSGLLFRHYGLAKAERRALFKAARAIARKRRVVVLLAGSVREVSTMKRTSLKTASVHTVRELIAADRARADLIFVSPVFPTRSHPGERTLGRSGFATLARRAKVPVIALGGMNARRARTLKGAYGWAGIDAWL